MIRQFLTVVLVVAASCVVALAGPAQPAHIVVRIEGFDQETDFEVMSPADLAREQRLAALEAKLLPQAYAEAKKEWRENKEGAEKTFPISKPRPRKVVKQSSGTTAERAEEKMDKYAEKAAKERNRLNERKSEQLEKMSDSKRERYVKREALEEEALDLIIEKLEALVEAALAKTRKR